jgi:hypothetical protein
MSRIFGKKRALLGIVASLAIAAAAIAYWTAGGSGDGSATTQGAQTALDADQTTVLTAMFPGDEAQNIEGLLENDNDADIYVSTVTASIASVTKATGAPAGVCDATDYSLTNATMTVEDEVPGHGTLSYGGADIQFNNKADDNQDACKGATVALSYAVN